VLVNGGGKPMAMTGGCYCGDVRYEVTGESAFKGQCHCRENLFMMFPATNFSYTKGEPKGFKRADLPNGVTREFCGNCGTHLVTRVAGGNLVVKVGTLDDPKEYGGPQMVIFTKDAQPFHLFPENVPTFAGLPGR
jgi:hypothetical protein